MIIALAMTASPLIKDEKYTIFGAEFTKLRWGHCFPCCKSRTNLSYGATTADQCKTIAVAASSTGCFAATGLLAIFAGSLATPTVPVVAAATTASSVTCGCSAFLATIWYTLHSQRHKRRGKIIASYNPTSQEATSTIAARSPTMSMQQTLIDCGLRPASEIGPGLYWEFHNDDPTSTPVLVKLGHREVNNFFVDGQIQRAWSFKLETVDTSSKGPHLSEAPLNHEKDWKAQVKTEQSQSLDKEVARMKELKLAGLEETVLDTSAGRNTVIELPPPPAVVEPEPPKSESFSATPWPYQLRVDPDKIPDSTFCIWVPKPEFKGYRLKSHTGPKDITKLPFNPKFFDIWTSSVPQKSSCKSGAVSVGMYHAMARLHHSIDPRVCYVTKGFGTKDDETPQLYTSLSKSGLFPDPKNFTHLTEPSAKNLLALREKEGMLPLIDNLDDLIAFEWDLNWGMLQVKAVNAAPCKITDPTCHSISVNNVDGIFCHTKYNISEDKAVSRALGVVETKRQCGVGTSGALGWIKIGGQWFYTDIHHGGSPGATGFHNRSSSVGAICAVVKKHEKKKWGPTYSQAFEDNVWGPIERDVRALIEAEQTYGIEIEPHKDLNVVEPALRVPKEFGRDYFPVSESHNLVNEGPPKHEGLTSKSQWQKGVKKIAKSTPRKANGKLNYALARSTVYAAYSDEMAEYDPEAHWAARMMLGLDGDSMYQTVAGDWRDDDMSWNNVNDFGDRLRDYGEAPTVLAGEPTYSKQTILDYMRSISGPVIVYDLAVHCKRPKKDVRIILHALQNFSPPLVEQVSSQAWIAVESSREHVMEESGYGIATSAVPSKVKTPAPEQATTPAPEQATLLPDANTTQYFDISDAEKASESPQAAPAILAPVAASEVAPAILAPVAASAVPAKKQPSTPDATIEIHKYLNAAIARCEEKKIAESLPMPTPVLETIEEVAAASPEIIDARSRRHQKNLERKQRNREKRPAPKVKPKSEPKAKAVPPTPVGAKAPVVDSLCQPPSSSNIPPPKDTTKGTPPIAVPTEIKATSNAPVVYGTYSGDPTAELLAQEPIPPATARIISRNRTLPTVDEDMVLVGEPHSLIRVLNLAPSPFAHLTPHQRSELYYPSGRVITPPPGLSGTSTLPNTGIDSTTMYLHNVESLTPPGADSVSNYARRSFSPPPCPLTKTRLGRWLSTSPITHCPTCSPTWDGWHCNVCGVTNPDKPVAPHPMINYYVLGQDGQFCAQPLSYPAPAE